MAEMQNLFDKQPLYPYVNLSIGGKSVSTEDGYYELQDGENISSFDDDNAQTVIEFTLKKQNSESGGSGANLFGQFTLSLFDDTAIYVEHLIATAMTNTAIKVQEATEAGDNSAGLNLNITIEYGWAYDGKRIEGRYTKFRGQIMSYELTFEGPSTTLDVQGEALPDSALSVCAQNEFDSETYEGKPSEIVKKICDINGWIYDDESIVETEVVYDDTDTSQPRVFIQNGVSYISFISNDLAPYAKSLNGDTVYSFCLEEVEGENGEIQYKAYFQPTSQFNGNKVDSQESDEEGEDASTNYSGENPLLDAEPLRRYEYYSGNTHNEVISFSPTFSFIPGTYSVSQVSATDPASNEFYTNTLNGKQIVVTGEGDVEVKIDGGRMMGMSASNYRTLQAMSEELWNMTMYQQVTATLEVLGDPQIGLYDGGQPTVLEVSLYTKYGIKHHTSGKYMINTIEDTVSAGSYITTIEMTKVVGMNQGSMYEEGEGAGKKGELQEDGTRTPYVSNLYDWTVTAEKEVGNNEKDGTADKYVEYTGRGDDETPPRAEDYSWGPDFVSYVMEQSKNPIYEPETTVQGILEQAKRKNLYQPSPALGGDYVPVRGDIAIFAERGSSRVGIVSEIDKEYFINIEGNCGKNGEVKKVRRSMLDTTLSGFYTLGPSKDATGLVDMKNPDVDEPEKNPDNPNNPNNPDNPNNPIVPDNPSYNTEEYKAIEDLVRNVQGIPAGDLVNDPNAIRLSSLLGVSAEMFYDMVNYDFDNTVKLVVEAMGL